MAIGASEKAAPAEEGKSAEQTFWRRISKPLLFWRRIPKPLLVTLVGLLLSAWLLPAITRQWDDRQKAHELQAGLVSDMADATARMIVRADSVRTRGSRNSVVGASDWARSSLIIEARMKAYFPQRIVDGWQLYSYFVSYIDPTARTQATRSAVQNVADDLSQLHDTSMEGLVINVASLAPLIDKGRTVSERKSLGIFESLNTQLNFDEYKIFAVGTSEYYKRLSMNGRAAAFEERLISMDDDLAERVLATGPKGYSTSFGDLVHDLIP